MLTLELAPDHRLGSDHSQFHTKCYCCIVRLGKIMYKNKQKNNSCECERLAWGGEVWQPHVWVVYGWWCAVIYLIDVHRRRGWRVE